MDTKMWSYKLVWDTMFAPNPLFDVLTLATCKPKIRRSPNTKEGMWIAGWTACTLHNSPAFGGGITRCKRGEEKLVYLAQISDILTLDEYWSKYPQKRCYDVIDTIDAQWYGDNIYHKGHTDDDGNVVAIHNNGGHFGAKTGKTDYGYGKNALICKRFYYFTPETRMEVPDRFKHLVHGGRGESIKTSQVDEFIKYVSDYAAKEGVDNGIVGYIPICYPEQYVTDENEFFQANHISNNGCKRKGCAK